MMEKAREIRMIRAENLVPHPKNPRKNLGDLTELTESIRKNGIMQNLSVVPMEDGRYQIVIGHRRYAAGMRAGLTEFPCIVTDMDEREQLCTMMEENMQRQDLTIPEQAYGFQYMLDLGETVEQIAERTGFSEKTVKHRLEIAKLNRKTLENAIKNDEWQMTIADLISLEKIKDVKRRNEVLKECAGTSHSRLQWVLQSAMADEREDENLKTWMPLIEAAGIKRDDKYEVYGFHEKYVRIKEINLTEPYKKTKKLAFRKAYKDAPVLWDVKYRTLYFFQKRPKGEQPELTEEQKKAKEREAKEKKLGEKYGQALKEMRMAAKTVYEGTVEPLLDELQMIWDLILLAEKTGADINTRDITTLAGKKHRWDITAEERNEIEPELEKKAASTKLLVWMSAEWTKDQLSIFGYGKEIIKDRMKKVNLIYETLQDLYGFAFSDPEFNKILDGTHPLYEKKEER